MKNCWCWHVDWCWFSRPLISIGVDWCIDEKDTGFSLAGLVEISNAVFKHCSWLTGILTNCATLQNWNWDPASLMSLLTYFDPLAASAWSSAQERDPDGVRPSTFHKRSSSVESKPLKKLPKSPGENWGWVNTCQHLKFAHRGGSQRFSGCPTAGALEHPWVKSLGSKNEAGWVTASISFKKAD